MKPLDQSQHSTTSRNCLIELIRRRCLRLKVALRFWICSTFCASTQFDWIMLAAGSSLPILLDSLSARWSKDKPAIIAWQGTSVPRWYSWLDCKAVLIWICTGSQEQVGFMLEKIDLAVLYSLTSLRMNTLPRYSVFDYTSVDFLDDLCCFVLEFLMPT